MYNNIIVRIGTEEINAVILHSNIIFIKKFSLLNLLWEDYNNYYTVFITGLYNYLKLLARSNPTNNIPHNDDYYRQNV